jgi:hypothetical protein
MTKEEFANIKLNTIIYFYDSTSAKFCIKAARATFKTDYRVYVGKFGASIPVYFENAFFSMADALEEKNKRLQERMNFIRAERDKAITEIEEERASLKDLVEPEIPDSLY